MRLLVDCDPFDGGRSGISVYIRNVVRELVAAGHEVTAIAEEGVGPSDFGVGDGLLFDPRFRSPRSSLRSMLWHLLVLPRRIRKGRFDAMLVLAANRRMPGRVRIPTVAVVHDLSQYHVEAKYGPLHMLYIKHVLPHYVRKAHGIVAISRSTAADLTRYWRVPEKRISVVYNGFTPPKACGDARSSDGGVCPGSILYISRIEHPGKNHINLIEAYERLRPDADLVFAGGDWNGAEAVHARAEASPLKDRIRFLGFVPDAEMPKLWSEARAYVFPSRFEGFGLSLLEAMAAGVPCACSKTSSLGELGEGVAELFDPEDPSDIAAALKRVLEANVGARISAGREKAASFSWRRCAEGLMKSFPPSTVFGVPVHCDTMEEALDRIRRCRRESSDGRFPRKAFFAFVNAHCLNLACRDGAYAEILRRCDRVWPDGTGVRMAGAKLGFPVPENVNGTDMFPLLSGRIFLYGAAPGVAAQAAENVRRLYPQMEIVGAMDGFGDERQVIAAVNEVRPDILLVAKGVPLQEKWISAHLAELDCGCAIAVGGLLDFVSGRIPRAPGWMRRMGVEWIFRFLQEPKRMFRRYILGNPLFLWRLRREAAVRRRG